MCLEVPVIYDGGMEPVMMMKMYDANSRTMMEVGGWRSQLYNEGMWSN